MCYGPALPGKQTHSFQAGHSKDLEFVSQELRAKGQTFVQRTLFAAYTHIA